MNEESYKFSDAFSDGLEAAARFHDQKAYELASHARWDSDGNPSNGPAISSEKHKFYASNIRGMKPLSIDDEVA